MKKSSPKAQVKSPQNRKARLTEKSVSFHGRGAEDMAEKKLSRPRTVPELFPSRNVVLNEKMVSQKLTKLLLNVTVHRSLGPVHVLISPDSSVGDLISAVLRQYEKEGRRPVFGSFDPDGFDLHYSQFSLEIHRSLGPVHVLISPDSSVGDLIAAVLRQYVKEGRRPVFGSFDPNGFDLHYSQFSLESLSRDEKLNELGSRNFFLCPKKVEVGAGYGGTSSSSCSKEAEKVTKSGVGWLRFMEFML